MRGTPHKNNGYYQFNIEFSASQVKPLAIRFPAAQTEVEDITPPPCSLCLQDSRLSESQSPAFNRFMQRYVCGTFFCSFSSARWAIRGERLSSRAMVSGAGIGLIGGPPVEVHDDVGAEADPLGKVGKLAASCGIGRERALSPAQVQWISAHIANATQPRHRRVIPAADMHIGAAFQLVVISLNQFAGERLIIILSAISPCTDRKACGLCGVSQTH